MSYLTSPGPNLAGRTCIVLASGPSLNDEQVARVLLAWNGPQKPLVIAVCSTYKIAAFADVYYAGDFLWWKHHHADARKRAAAFGSQLWTQDRTSAERYQLRWVKGVNKPGLSDKREIVHMQGNSGMTAMHLAFNWGCRRMVLLGFDMKLGANGERHWHGDHPQPLVQAQCFGDWLHKGERFARELLAAGCDVVNCTPGSAWRDFPMAPIEEVLR